MLAALRENWKYKLLALACAVALHTYVAGQNNAGQSRTLIVPLTVRNTPPNLLTDEKALPQITLMLTGPTEETTQISDMAVTVSVDLSHAHAGQNGPLPVHVTLPPGTSSTVVADPQPSVLTIELQPKRSRRLQVTATEPGAPPAGYAFRPAQITPRRVLAIGGQDAVAAIQQLVIKSDEDAIGTVDDVFPIVALDGEGSQVEGVTLVPPTAHVRIEMVRVPLSRALFVSPNITGVPTFPARVTDIQVNPPTLRVTGHSDRLAQIGTITTAPIDVSGATADIVRQVACTAPPGLTLIGSGVVTVTVRIPPTPAPPGPPAPMSPVPMPTVTPTAP